MKIYTKKGDKGETSLLGGSRIDKNHLRIEAYGTLDELNAFMGSLSDGEENPERQAFLKKIQEELFNLGSLLAVEPGKKNIPLPSLDPHLVQEMEDWMDASDSILPPLKNFILPGGHPRVSQAHICRTICRRAERRVISLGQNEAIPDGAIAFLNRLSDYFFIISRVYSHELGVAENLWTGRK